MILLNILFFYTSIVVLWITLSVCIYYKPLEFRNTVIGITASAFALVYDVTLGDHFGLYYYVNPQVSTTYMVLAALFIYSIIGIIYTLFLPKDYTKVLVYTTIWIVVMLLFEYVSVKTKTIVFTGWQPVPWSFVSYVVTFGWMYMFYRYMMKHRDNSFASQ